MASRTSRRPGSERVPPLRAEPVRSCAGCRARRPKGELIRFARGPAGPVLDRSGRVQGRGGYVCPEQACLDRALRRGGLAKALRTPIAPAQAAALRLEAVEYLVGGHGET
ncbi:MAG TPA: YlxR family protein, partial [Actinomycetota bacterium]